MLAAACFFAVLFACGAVGWRVAWAEYTRHGRGFRIIASTLFAWVGVLLGLLLVLVIAALTLAALSLGALAHVLQLLFSHFL